MRKWKFQFQFCTISSEPRQTCLNLQSRKIRMISSSKENWRSRELSLSRTHCTLHCTRVVIYDSDIRLLLLITLTIMIMIDFTFTPRHWHADHRMIMIMMSNDCSTILTRHKSFLFLDAPGSHLYANNQV